MESQLLEALTEHSAPDQLHAEDSPAQDLDCQKPPVIT